MDFEKILGVEVAIRNELTSLHELFESLQQDVCELKKEIEPPLFQAMDFQKVMGVQVVIRNEIASLHGVLENLQQDFYEFKRRIDPPTPKLDLPEPGEDLKGRQYYACYDEDSEGRFLKDISTHATVERVCVATWGKMLKMVNMQEIQGKAIAENIKQDGIKVEDNVERFCQAMWVRLGVYIEQMTKTQTDQLKAFEELVKQQGEETKRIQTSFWEHLAKDNDLFKAYIDEKIADTIHSQVDKFCLAMCEMEKALDERLEQRVQGRLEEEREATNAINRVEKQLNDITIVIEK